MLPNSKEVWGLLGSPCPPLSPLGPVILLLLCNLDTLIHLESTVWAKAIGLCMYCL